MLEPTHYIRVSYTRKEGTLHLLNEASLLESFSKIRDDYERLDLGFYFLKIIGKVSLEGVLDSQNSFNLLGLSLKCLETTQDLNKLRIFFETKLLQQQGVLPNKTFLFEVLSLSILDHEKVNISLKQWSDLRGLVHRTMKQYIEV